VRPTKIKDVLDLLVGAGANINETDDNGETFLHRLARNCDLVDTIKVRSLLQAGLDPEIRNQDGKSALDILEEEFEGEKSVKEIIKAYLVNGPSWREPNTPPFRLFIQTMGGQTYPIALPSADSTVLDLKKAIYNREVNVAPEDNVLRFQKKISLDNDHARLSDHKIQNEDAILSILVGKKNF